MERLVLMTYKENGKLERQQLQVISQEKVGNFYFVYSGSPLIPAKRLAQGYHLVITK